MLKFISALVWEMVLFRYLFNFFTRHDSGALRSYSISFNKEVFTHIICVRRGDSSFLFQEHVKIVARFLAMFILVNTKYDWFVDIVVPKLKFVAIYSLTDLRIFLAA